MATKFYVHTLGEPPEENPPGEGVPQEATRDTDERLDEIQRTLDAILAAVTDNEEE